MGLLLENPVFDGYNIKLTKSDYEPIDFTKFDKEMNEFKMKYIYDKIYAEESKENIFMDFSVILMLIEVIKMKMVNQFKMVLVFLISYLIILKELKIPRIKMQRTPQRLKSQSLKNQKPEESKSEQS